MFGRYYSEEQRQIEEQLKLDCENPELYEKLGDCIVMHNKYQAYLCYENAAFFSNEQHVKSEMQTKIDWLCSLGYEVPKAAIVILNHNLKAMTQECIDSIRKTTPVAAREIILIDNASTDGSVEWFQSQDDVIVQANGENAGFPGGCNQGIALAQKDSDIFLLNNDTVLCVNSLFWLRMGLYDREDIGSAGSGSNYVSNNQYLIQDKLGLEEYLDFAKKNNVPIETKLEHKLYLVGFAVLIKRMALEKIGYLDNRFYPGHYEDTDLGLRLLQAGYQNVFVRNSFIIHWGSKTFAKTYFGGRVLVTNREKFCQKYGLESDESLNVNAKILGRFHSIQDDLNNANVLEINCGLGATLLQLKSLYPDTHFYGVERNNMEALYGSHLQSVAIRNYYDCSDLPFDDEFFDIVILDTRMLHPDDLVPMLTSISRCLKSTGRIYIYAVNLQHFSYWLSLALDGEPSNNDLNTISEKMVNQAIKDKELHISRWIFNIEKSADEKINDMLESIGNNMVDKNRIFISAVWIEACK